MAAKPGKNRQPVDQPDVRRHGARMGAHMVFLAVVLSESGVRHRRISLPMVEVLLDGVRYFKPGELPEARGEELRAMCRPKPAQVLAARPVRATAAERAAERRDQARRREDRDLKQLAELLGDPL
jgi:hypothetical protein